MLEIVSNLEVFIKIIKEYHNIKIILKKIGHFVNLNRNNKLHFHNLKLYNQDLIVLQNLNKRNKIKNQQYQLMSIIR